MTKIIEIKIVGHYNDFDKFEDEVNGLFSKGWVLHEKLHVLIGNNLSVTLVQAMKKTSDDQQNHVS